MRRNDLSGSTLNFLILKALDSGAEHGYGIARWVEAVTEDALSLEEGSLYPALHRLEKRGWLESRWGKSENNRSAKFYRLTGKGRRQLAKEHENWNRLSAAIVKVAMAGPRAAEGEG
jgi:transcriptional regulator